MHQRKCGVVERDLDLLALATFFSLVHREKYADAAIEAHRNVDHRKAEAHGARLHRAVDAIVAGHGADDAIVTREAAERACVAEA